MGQGALPTRRAHTGAEIGIADEVFDRQGKRVVTASTDSKVRIFDADSGKLIHTLEGHIDRVESASFDPEGRRIVSSSFDATVRVWDAEKGSFVPHGINVLTLRGARIEGITIFLTPGALATFGLPT